jgi:tRNA pseudouridine32 synthase/23S rRNA pseudouridine746 synthase
MDGFRVVEDNPEFLVVVKYAGVDMHDDNGIPGLVSRVSVFLNQPVYPVHRLDKVTSGLVILAKTSEAAHQLSDLFARREIKKTYLAVSDRKPKKKQGWIRGDMGKARNGSWKLLHSMENPAITFFESKALAVPGFRLFIVSPATGKTHQIRVALKSISAPIYGDQRYGGTTADRTYLHAFRLEFSFMGQQYQFTDLPDWSSFSLACIQ